MLPIYLLVQGSRGEEVAFHCFASTHTLGRGGEVQRDNIFRDWKDGCLLLHSDLLALSLASNEGNPELIWCVVLLKMLLHLGSYGCYAIPLIVNKISLTAFHECPKTRAKQVIDSYLLNSVTAS